MLRARALASRAAAGGRPGGAWAHAHILELRERHGFGWAIKAALESELVRTRHVLIVQHDRSLMRAFDLARAVRVMRADERVRDGADVGVAVEHAADADFEVDARERVHAEVPLLREHLDRVVRRRRRRSQS